MTPQIQEEFTIQELCDRTGLPRRTIHFYTQQEILPPPNSAGVGARYTEEHLLRLQLIPYFRRRGLRLDDIRERYQKLTLEDLNHLYQTTETMNLDEPIHVKGRSYLHYELPGDLTLIAPATMGSADRQRLNQLIDTAHELFKKPNEATASTSYEG